jgi:hypothetical protein
MHSLPRGHGADGKVKNTSLCGLGQTAPNPVLSTLKYFRSEYEELLQPDKFGPRTNPSETATK